MFVIYLQTVFILLKQAPVSYAMVLGLMVVKHLISIISWWDKFLSDKNVKLTCASPLNIHKITFALPVNLMNIAQHCS